MTGMILVNVLLAATFLMVILSKFKAFIGKSVVLT